MVAMPLGRRCENFASVSLTAHVVDEVGRMILPSVATCQPVRESSSNRIIVADIIGEPVRAQDLLLDGLEIDSPCQLITLGQVSIPLSCRIDLILILGGG